MEVLVIAIIVIAAVTAVILPLVRRSPAEALETPEPTFDETAIEAEIRRYREALREGTLCRRCGEPNPAGSRFCANCGRALTEAA